MNSGARPRPDRTPAVARVAGLLGALGLCGVAWVDTRADGDTAHLAFVVWAAVGIGVLTAGIILQYGRLRDGTVREAVPRTPHNEDTARAHSEDTPSTCDGGTAAGRVPAPRQESLPGVTSARRAPASSARFRGESRAG
ncbi:hypothetical protein ACIBI4_02990 [Streptomyces sp. NPDC050418]|uniref:hypothetical protein n=1 Tax=Streptomyces sp. NPDC050418 TaxID=3365612 RepID=UPI003798AD74